MNQLELSKGQRRLLYYCFRHGGFYVHYLHDNILIFVFKSTSVVLKMVPVGIQAYVVILIKHFYLMALLLKNSDLFGCISAILPT